MWGVWPVSWLSARRGLRRGKKKRGGGVKSAQTQLPFSYVAPAALLKHTHHACWASLVKALSAAASAAMRVSAAQFSRSTSAAAADPPPAQA